MIFENQSGGHVANNSTPVWVVRDVVPHQDYTLLLTFARGEKRLFNASELLEEDLYAPLKELSFFMNVKVDGDSVAWDERIDIAPEYLYEKSVPCV